MDQSDWMIISFIRDWYSVDIGDVEFYYNGNVSEYSWAAVLTVFKKDGQIYINDSTENWEPYPVTESEALDAMIEFECI